MNIVGFAFIAMSLAAFLVSIVLIVLALVRLTRPASRVKGLVGLGAGILGGVLTLALRFGLEMIFGLPKHAPHAAFNILFIFLGVGFSPAALVAEMAFWIKARESRAAR